MGYEARIRLAGQGGGLVRPDGRAAQDTPKVALGFAFGTLHWPFVSSLLGLREYAIAEAKAGRMPLVHHILPRPGLYIGENRNRIVQRFLATDAEWLLQVDTDIEFPPQLPEMLLAVAGTERKVIAASVPLSWNSENQEPLPSCAMNRIPGRPGMYLYLTPDEIPETGIEVDAVASAALLVHRSVFDAIADMVGQCWFLQSGPGSIIPDFNDAESRVAWADDGHVRNRKYMHIGEDVLFCLRAENAGFRSFCVRVPGLRHYKVVPLTHDGDERLAAATAAMEASR